MPDDERLSLFDISDVIDALKEAQEALRKVMAGEEDELSLLLFKLGFARGRLGRVCDRYYPAKEKEEEEKQCP